MPQAARCATTSGSASKLTRAHDARILAEQIAALESAAADMAAAGRALGAIEGRDARLDGLLAAEQPLKDAVILRLRELLAKLAPQLPSQPAPRPSPADLADAEDFI